MQIPAHAESPSSSTPSRYPWITALAAAMGKPFFIMDLEATTGDLKDPEFGVVEVGYVLVRFDGSDSEDTYLLDPGLPMNPYAARLTGIATRDYAGQPGFEARWPGIEPLLRGCVVSGFGVHDLDCKALFQEAHKRVPGGIERFCIDSLDARSLWRIHSGSDKGQLSEVALAFGHAGGRPHRALEDARAAASALEGLIAAMGVKACAQAARRQWNPLESIDQAARAAEAAQAHLARALLACSGCADFAQGLAIMESHGLRPHLSSKGLSWWIDNSPARWPAAPDTPQKLAAHFGAPMPPHLAQSDSLARCSALLAASPGPLNDEDASRAALCRSRGTAAAARAKSIRDGSLPPWSGILPSLQELARATGASHDDERSALDAIRVLAAASGVSPGHPALSACAASLSIELGLGSPQDAKPRTRGPTP